MGSISLLGTRTPQLVCLFAKSSCGRHTLEPAVAAAADESQNQERVESEISKLDTTEGGAAQVRQPGWRRVRESLHGRWQRCHDLHEHPELGRQGPCEEDGQEHREEYCQEHRGDGVGGEEGGDTSRS